MSSNATPYRPVIVVCGSRGYNDLEKIRKVLSRYADQNPIIRHGDAPGADKAAELVARSLHMDTDPCPAEWGKYPKTKNGKDPAGMIRNAWMLKKPGDVILVLAFWDGSSPGTRGMIKIAQDQRVEVKVYR